VSGAPEQHPSTPAEAAAALAACAADDSRVRLRGNGTKLTWGTPFDVDVELSTARLDGIVEHNAADLTAVVESGCGLRAAQEAVAEHGQMLALDPPLGAGDAATVGGIVATGDSGPLRQRYGGARDLLLGMRVALADGTIARSGGKVIKNVAGYDLAKLFAGSFGTLGLILEVVVRLHPIPTHRVTVVGASGDAGSLQEAALEVARRPLEPEALDVTWVGDGGAVLTRLAGASAASQAEDVCAVMAAAGVDAEAHDDDADIWEDQRARQRARSGAVVRVSALPAELARVLRCAERLGGTVVGRAGLGLSWVALAGEPDDLVSAVEELRRDLSPRPCVVLDAPPEVRAKIDVWDERDTARTALMRRVKRRFDRSGACNPGIYVGGM
jgi:glycolate oxidase FAD binding subunit